MAAKAFLRLPILLPLFFLGLLSSPGRAAQILGTDESLHSGQSLNNGPYSFTMQKDCNLVLYDAGRAVWASNTGGRGTSCRVTMQKDGNLVVYTSSNSAVWASGTNRGHGNYVLVLQSDRNVVIYSNPIWATGTHTYGDGVTITPAPANLKNETSAATAAGGGEVGLGRKIDMVIAKA